MLTCVKIFKIKSYCMEGLKACNFTKNELLRRRYFSNILLNNFSYFLLYFGKLGTTRKEHVSVAASEKNYVSNAVGISKNLPISSLINQKLRFHAGKKKGATSLKAGKFAKHMLISTTDSRLDVLVSVMLIKKNIYSPFFNHHHSFEIFHHLNLLKNIIIY